MKLKWAVPLVFLVVLVLCLTGMAQNYAPATNYPTNAAPQGLAVADFNEDGKPDIAVTDFNASAVQILPGNGDGTFGPTSGTAIAAHPYSMATADLNSDGHSDLVISLITAQGFEVLFGDGRGQFQSPTIYTVSGLPAGNTVGEAVLKDVNRDGKIDLVLATDRGMAVFINDGLGNFTQASTMVDPSNVIANVALIDLDGDGVPDLVATESTFDVNGNPTGTVVYALGHGDGTFGAVTNIANLSGPPTGLAVADVDRDGRLDIVASFATSTIGTGGGGTVGGCPTPRICLPQDGGGGTTITVPGGIALVRQTSKLQFAATNSIGTDHNPGFLVAADFDGDGRIDVAEANTAQPTILVYRGNGDGTFAQAVSLAIPSIAAEIATGSFTQTVAQDLLASDNLTNQISVFVNQGANTLSLVSSLNPVGVSQAVTLTATVQPKFPSAGTLSGSVIFADGQTTLGTATVNTAGAASLTATFASAGDHNLTAVYGGNNTFVGGASAALVEKVAIAPSVTLSSSANPSSATQSVNFTVAVTNSRSGPSPSGTVTLFANGTPVLSGTIDAGGVAVLSTSSLPLGTNDLLAQYSGDSNYPGADSTHVAQVVNKSSSTTTLTSSVNPSSFGQPINFTITVTDRFGGTPTGNVTLRDAGTAINTAALNGTGAAVITISSLSAGSHSLTVDYAGDASFNPSSSATLSQSVNATSTTTVLSTSPNPSAPGQALILRAVVKPSGGTGTPSGNVAFNDGGSVLGSANLDASGTATLTVTSLVLGSHTLTASYAGNGGFQGSTSGAVTQVVSTTSTSVALSAAPDPSSLGQAVALSAVVKAVTGAVPSGVVVFNEGTGVLGSANLDATGTAVLMVTSFAIGSHNLSASYAGNGSFQGSKSAVITQVVNRASVQVVLSSSASPATFGQNLTLRVTVTPTFAGTTPVPTGSINFTDGGSVLGQVLIDNTGKAALTTRSLIAGTHLLSATYAGDSNFSGNSASLSQVVNKATTTTALASSLNPATNASSILLHAVVATATGTPSGTVQFFDGATSIGSAPLDGTGSASLSVASLAVGDHSVTASYTGSTNLASSTSAGLSEEIVDSHSHVLLSSSANPQKSSQVVVLTATVTPALRGQPVNGTITFRDGAEVLASVPVNNEGASFSTTHLSVGMHLIMATYQASTTPGPFDGSSAPLTEVIQSSSAPDYSVSIQPAKGSILQGSTFTTSVTVAPVNGFSGAVTLGCAGLPANASCVFVPAQVTVSGQAPATSRLQLVTARYTSANDQEPALPRPNLERALGLWFAPGVFGCVLLQNRKPMRRALLVISVLACGMLIAGCGSSSTSRPNQTHQPHTYNISVTASSGTVVHSTPLQLTLQ